MMHTRALVALVALALSVLVAGSGDVGSQVPGLDCGRIRLQVEDGQGGANWISYPFLTMDQSFFDHAYPDGLRSQIVVLDACGSDALQLDGEGAVLGWTDTIKISSSIKTMNGLFQHLVGDGLALLDVLNKLEDGGLLRYEELVDVAGGAARTTPELVLQGDLFLRAREVVHLVDPVRGTSSATPPS
jgi:hypothetical protein